MGWLLTVLQKERADTEVLSEALRVAMSRLNEMETSETMHRHQLIWYLLLLVLHRRPAVEHEGLIKLIDRRVPDMEVESMAATMAEVLVERGLEQKA